MFTILLLPATPKNINRMKNNNKYRQSPAYAVFRDSGKPCKLKTTLLEELFSTKTKKWDFRISKVHFFPFVFLYCMPKIPVQDFHECFLVEFKKKKLTGQGPFIN